jgi:hypothetical protein
MIQWPSYIVGLIGVAVVGHIVGNYSLRQYYDIIDHYCWRFKGRVVHVVIDCIVVNYCLRFTEEWFVLLWLVILSTIAV